MGNVFAYVSVKSNDGDETKVIKDHPKKLKPLKLNDDTEQLTRPAFIEDGDNVSSPALKLERNKDVPDGNVISNILEAHDSEFESLENKVQIINLNHGGFLKMEPNNHDGFSVLANGRRSDGYAVWQAHLTVDEEHRQILVFENVECSRLKKEKCVLCSEVNASEGFILSGKTIVDIPTTLRKLDRSIAFYKTRKAEGSELMFFKSMFSKKDRPLYVGFDGEGLPLPLNKVRKYSPDFQAFFRLIEAAY
ncbi:uncharacterized protein LOC124453608 [Xenia sp. Carnegie-2017]|uniref:uncharacterized protein LOC124453608 n=1 Tax=Xenia sp. Carnegie-2017 TaxID=2897299 RepID=UPI001F04EF9B|nr:uncharacterized protein LOC124453608 [Xenia sp. Carnegie-2017]